MTCGGCEAAVMSSLLSLPNVTAAEISREHQTAMISMDSHIPLIKLQEALGKKYSITAAGHHEITERGKNGWVTYKPILLIFGYISMIAVVAATHQTTTNWMRGMNVFMAGFFLTFSFFKMLDLKRFAESYSMYDIVAKKIPAWGIIYAFVELALGIAYTTGFRPIFTNIFTFSVMSISITGVLQSVLNKRKIQCACLGAVFNLPMSTVTIIEDGLMIAMSAGMIVTLTI